MDENESGKLGAVVKAWTMLQLDRTIVVIVLVAFLLRLWGIAFGLPRLYDPDEWHWVGRACRMLKDIDPNPHWFGNPGTPLMYLLAALYAVLFGLGLVMGSYSGVADFEALYFHDPTLFYLSGRVLSAAFGTATVLAVYVIARRVCDRRVGLIAATAVALSPTHILYSKIVRGDVPITFLLLVALWFCLNVLEGRHVRDYVAAGLFTGTAVATKYPAAIFVVSILWTHLESVRWQMRDLDKHRQLLASAVACLGGFILGSPFLLLDFQTALSDIKYEARPTHLGATGEGLARNLLWYLQGPLPTALSLTGSLLAALGVISFLTSKQRGRRALAGFPVFFLVFVSSLSLRWDRWIIPAIPFLCIPLAHTIDKGTTWLGHRVNARLVPWLSLAMLMLVTVPLLTADLAQGQALSSPDTRTIAGEWMLANIPEGSRVLMEAYTPQLRKDAFAFFEVNGDGQIEAIDPDTMDHWLFRASGSIGRLDDAGRAAEAGIQYVVMSNLYERYVAEGEKYSQRAQRYDRILLDAELIYEIPGVRAGEPHHRGGPRIRIYKVQ